MLGSDGSRPLLAYITRIGADPAQVEYRLTGGHGCTDPGGTDRQFTYRTGRSERPLTWIGRGLAEVGLTAGTELTEDQFDLARALMRGAHPHTDEQLVAPKLAVPHDAKLPLSPLVRAVHGAAREARVPLAEVLGHNTRLITRFATAERAVDRTGETARLRADEAGDLARAAGLGVDEIWGDDTYTATAANLWTTRTERHSDGTVHRVRVPRRTIVGNRGYDITATLPKSYSVLLALGSADLADTVEPLYLDAVQRTFAWLENTTAYGMRGHHGDGHTARTVPGSGFLGWTMVHRAARPADGREVGDPHWHVHISIANMTRGTDGQWSTVAAGGRDLMRHANAFDHILKALVRHDLHQALPGIRYYRNTRTGAWEIAGISDATLAGFSQRHREIKTTLAALGVDPDTASRAQERVAEQRSRGPKTEATTAPDATLQNLWQREERGAGRDPADTVRRVAHGGQDPIANDSSPDATATANTTSNASSAASGSTGRSASMPALAVNATSLGVLLDRGGDTPGESPDDDATSPEPGAPVDVDAIVAVLLDPQTGLTAHGRRFTRADVLARVADALPYGAGSPAEIEALADTVLRHAGFVPLTNQEIEGPAGERADLAASHMANAGRWTTRDVIDAELVVLSTAHASHPDQSSVRVTDPDLIGLAIDTVQAQDRFELADEQRAALYRLLTHGRMLDTVQGGPGTGKTTLMRALRLALEAAGHTVAGVATAALAAQHLHIESGIPARTLAALLTAVEHGHDPLADVDVLVVDEANLTDDRDRAALYRHAAAHGTRIVEVGDRHQLRGVGVGSLFGRIHDIVDGPELRDNRRQVEADEREALAAWRDGRYTEALTLWADKTRLVATDASNQATTAMLADWWDQHRGAPDPHTEMRGLVMLTATNEQVRRLNDAAQALRHTHGELGPGYTYHLPGGDIVQLHVGDHVLLKHNDQLQINVAGASVLNGYRGVITAIHRSGDLTIDWRHNTDDGTELRTVTVTPDYVALGGVSLGYAMTVHKSEGLTVKQQWTRPDGVLSGATVLFHADGADNPAMYVALSRHRRAVHIYASRARLETADDAYYLGAPRSRAELIDRVIATVAERARDTETHADDEPVVADLGLDDVLPAPPLRSRTGRDAHQAREDQPPTVGQTRPTHRGAEQAQRARAERQQHDRERVQAADWLRGIWRHESALVERIIAARRFPALARHLADAVEAGYDLHDVLAEIPLDRVGAGRVDDPAAYAVVLVDVAVERLRSGQADADARRAEARRAFEVMREQAADLVREEWSAHPDLVETVIASPAFTALTRALDQFVDAGLGVRTLLRAVPLAKIERNARDQSAYAVYLLRRVGDRHLAERNAARQQAREHTERQKRHAALTDLARQVWHHHGAATERVITGPSWRWLLTDLDQAQATGYDVRAALAQIDITRLTGCDVQNPSGAAAFALRRVLASMLPPTVDRPTHNAQDASLDLRQQPTISPPPRTFLEPLTTAVPSTDEPARQRPNVAEKPPLWTKRPHGRVPDSELHRRVDADRLHAERLAVERATAALRARELRAAVAAEQGPQVTALETRLDRLRTQVALAAEVDRLQVAWQTAVDRARHAAEQRAAAEHERGARNHRSRQQRDIDTRVAELRAIEDQAERESSELATRAAQLQHQLDDQNDDNRSRLQRRAAAVERDRPHAHDVAQRRDLAAAAAADRHFSQLSEQQRHLMDHIAEMSAELDLREQLPADLREIEDSERTTDTQLAPTSEPSGAVPSPESDAAEIGVVADVEQILDPTELSPELLDE